MIEYKVIVFQKNFCVLWSDRPQWFPAMYLEDSDSVELDSFSGYDNKEDQKDSIPSSDVHDTVCDKRQHLTLKCHFAYISVLLLGITSLLPWHSLITSVDYFNYLFPGIESDIAVPYTITSFLSMYPSQILFSYIQSCCGCERLWWDSSSCKHQDLRFFDRLSGLHSCHPNCPLRQSPVSMGHHCCLLFDW